MRSRDTVKRIRNEKEVKVARVNSLIKTCLKVGKMRPFSKIGMMIKGSKMMNGKSSTAKYGNGNTAKYGKSNMAIKTIRRESVKAIRNKRDPAAKNGNGDSKGDGNYCTD